MRPALVPFLLRSSLALIFLVLLAACGHPAVAPAPATPRVLDIAAAMPAAEGDEEVSLEILELMCSPCADKIVHGSRALHGVTFVSMQLNTKTLTVRFDPAITDRDAVVVAVDTIVASIR